MRRLCEFAISCPSRGRVWLGDAMYCITHAKALLLLAGLERAREAAHRRQEAKRDAD